MPGSSGEHGLQRLHGTTARARAFYDHQVLDRLSDRMQDFVRRMDMVFVATADAAGECDSSFRAGPPGFVGVLDERTLVYPEFRGNGVMASLGNLVENGSVGLLFLDLCGDRIGLHVNGRARLVAPEDLLARDGLPGSVREGAARTGGQAPQHWVLVEVVEAYIHCSKHIPHLARRDETGQVWGTDDAVAKGGDYFRVKHAPRPWVDVVPRPRSGDSGQEHHRVAELVPQVALGDGGLVRPRDE
jgi:uncharacterized protein